MKTFAIAMLVGMTPSIAHADVKAGEKKAQLCLVCHKPNNPMAHVPTLEGQTREYLHIQIKAYKEKRRPNLAMQTNAASLSARDVRDIVDYFVSRKPVRASFPLDATRVGRGKAKAAALKCAACHMPDYSGKKEIPRLAGLDQRYVAAQLVAFAEGKRAHPSADRMEDLSSGDAGDLAQYFGQIE